MKLRDRLRQRWHGIEPPPEPPRWTCADAWIPPQTGGGYAPDGHELAEANRRRRRRSRWPGVERASAEEMAAAGWRIDQRRDQRGRLR